MEVDEYQSNLRIWCIYIYRIYTKTYVSWTERISKIQQYSIVNTGIRYMHEGPWTSIKIASYEYWEAIVFLGGQSYLSFYGISPSQAMFSTSILNWSSPFCNTSYVFICIYTQIYENSLSQDSTHKLFALGEEVKKTHNILHDHRWNIIGPYVFLWNWKRPHGV